MSAGRLWKSTGRLEQCSESNLSLRGKKCTNIMQFVSIQLQITFILLMKKKSTAKETICAIDINVIKPSLFHKGLGLSFKGPLFLLRDLSHPLKVPRLTPEMLF